MPQNILKTIIDTNKTFKRISTILFLLISSMRNRYSNIKTEVTYLQRLIIRILYLNDKRDKKSLKYIFDLAIVYTKGFYPMNVNMIIVIAQH